MKKKNQKTVTFVKEQSRLESFGLITNAVTENCFAMTVTDEAKD